MMRIIFTIFILVLSDMAFAGPQPPPPNGVPGPPGDAPINEWIYFLWFISIVLAYYKLNNIKKRAV